ncbi:neural Wiskott-Aldrich syndrome protein-like [Leptopilina heterotoma]|uniref:neural Wiskott-Aldrich syndrome protein-like n=1 Tax=Leptopilina heterotoma TaxID=63436 RepID=UPI001CA866BF|nr:neural Wiskott-Aldrich syndrome protein-like [Leptopilina heterotoma]
MKSGITMEHRGSVLLNAEENKQVFELIGNRCLCLATGIIQLYLTEPPTHNEWLKRNTGVLTLIRDNPKRSFFLRLYCLQRKAMLWEHEIYNAIEYKAPAPFFQTFEGEESMMAFNFASEHDAFVLRNALVGILEAKRQKKQKRALRSSEATDSTKCEPPVELSSSSGNLFNGSPLTTSLNKSISNSSVFEKKKKHRENEKKRKLRKEDIGLPHNFRHVTHVGCNADSKHLELESIDPQLKEVFTTAGVSDNQLKNPKMRDFIYDFIDNHGGVQAFVKENALLNVKKSEVHDSKPPNALEPPPPVPPRTTSAVMFSSSNNGQTRTAPPLPPSKTLSPATPNAPPVHKVLPMRPPPPNTNSAAFFQPSQPPPPPPPPPSLKDATAAFSIPLPPPLPIFNDVETSTESSRKVENESSSTRNNISQGEDCRSMLMESIRSGTTLKKVTREEVKPKVQPDSRNDLLSQIRQGIELKPVSNEQKRSTVSVPQDGLIGALSRALAERSRAIHSDSDDSFSDSSEEDDWDD